MSIPYAFVTLLTSDAYLPGALTIAAALKDVHRPRALEYETVCLVAPETVDVTSIRFLRKAFNVVIGVEIIVPPDTGSLALLGRPDLDTALTKLHVFRLVQYNKVIFLDADVLPLRPLSHLFYLDHDFSAVPDVGWPDIFNSGVMVLSPGEDKFKQLQGLLSTKGTWDGADQGLLNEWRGSDWNRLSFTYNTTPTAIYTYAPAYQRFGSQISVIHFIGPHKPWHSIAYRAPGSAAQSTDMIADSATESPATHSLTYDYGSLVDRWYAVYDRHYRSENAEPILQPTRYTSAWNEGGLRQGIVPGGTLELEELRRIALEGMGSSGISTPRAHGEGEYRTMPLEGRFDLMRPRTRAERMQAQKSGTEAPESTSAPAERSTTPELSTPRGQILSVPEGSPARWTTLPTPGINELPPAPPRRLISLPPTPLNYVPAPYMPLGTTREAGAQTVPINPQQEESGQGEFTPTPLVSGFAIGTSPNVIAAAPTDTYFPKVWDIDRSWTSVSPSSSETSLTTMEPSPSSKPQSTSSALLGRSAPVTPDMPRSQGHNRNVIEAGNRSTTPDFTQVKRVFPWEERPRHTPGRVFPDEGSPLTGHRRGPAFATPERRFTFRSPMPSPLAGFPPSFHPHLVSDGRIRQRHVARVGRLIPSSSPLGFERDPDGVETGSQDGDIEDEVDSEEETILRLRRTSIEMAKHTPEYHSIGVQTDPKDLREEATTIVSATGEVENRVRHGLPTSTGTTDRAAVGTTHTSISPLLSPPIVDSHRQLSPSNTRDQRGSVLGNTSDISLSVVSPVGNPPFTHIRKGSRVWDAARGVEAFKRGSEEILAKFMKAGSRKEPPT